MTLLSETDLPRPLPHPIDYRLESDRLQTFHSWRYSHIVKPEDLAAAGFFCVNINTFDDDDDDDEGDIVKCFECGIELHRWKKGDDPMNEHRIWSRCCGYAHGGICGNVPLGTDPNEIVPQPRGMDVCGSQVKKFKLNLKRLIIIIFLHNIKKISMKNNMNFFLQ